MGRVENIPNHARVGNRGVFSQKISIRFKESYLQAAVQPHVERFDLAKFQIDISQFALY